MNVSLAPAADGVPAAAAFGMEGNAAFPLDVRTIRGDCVSHPSSPARDCKLMGPRLRALAAVRLQLPVRVQLDELLFF